jgi:hypothetical protein
MFQLTQTDGLTAVQQDILSAVREFVDAEIIPVASELDHSDTYPDRIVAGLARLGVFGLTIDPEYGGLGESLLTYALVAEEIARGWMSISGIINTHFIVAYLITRYGTAEQKESFLPAMAAGEVRAARRGRLRDQRPEDVADQRRIRPPGRPARPHSGTTTPRIRTSTRPESSPTARSWTGPHRTTTPYPDPARGGGTPGCSVLGSCAVTTSSISPSRTGPVWPRGARQPARPGAARRTGAATGPPSPQLPTARRPPSCCRYPQRMPALSEPASPAGLAHVTRR